MKHAHSVWGVLGGALRARPGAFAIASAAGLVVGAAGWSIAFAVQAVLDRSAEVGFVMLVCAATALVLLVRAAVSVLRRLVQLKLAQGIESDLATRFMAHVLRMEVQDVERFSIGDLVRRMRGLETIRHAIEDRLLGVPFDCVVVCAAVGVMASRSVSLAGVALAGALVPAVPVYILRGTIQRSFEAHQASEGQFGTRLLDALEGGRDLRVAGGTSWMVDRIESTYTEWQTKRLRHFGKLAVIQSITAWTSAAATILLLCLGAALATDGRLSSGQLMFLFTMAGVILGPLEQFAISWLFFQDASTAIRAAAEVEALPAEPREAAPSEGGIVGEIRLEHVTFGYDPSRPVLRDVSIAVPASSSLAIVGQTGAGKSTLMALVAGLHEPAAGRVLIDGRPVRTWPAELRAREIGVVLQGAHLFEGTVSENIGLGIADITDVSVREAARMACAAEFIERLPRGYDTVLSRDGAQLSAGQAQRIGLARALARQPRVLLLDEATSNLDAETEAAVWGALRSTGSRTTLFVTHRLATSAAADRVVVLCDGVVVEEGPFDELLDRREAFYALWKRQVAAPMAR